MADACKVKSRKKKKVASSACQVPSAGSSAANTPHGACPRGAGSPVPALRALCPLQCVFTLELALLTEDVRVAAEQTPEAWDPW